MEDDNNFIRDVFDIFQRSQFVKSKFLQSSSVVVDLLNLYKKDIKIINKSNGNKSSSKGNNNNTYQKMSFIFTIEHIIKHLLSYSNSTKDDIVSNSIRLLVAMCEKIDKYIIESSAKTKNLNESFQEDTLTDILIRFILSFTNASDKLIRLRTCQMIEQLLNNTSNINDDLGCSIENALISRMSDKHILVRVAAVFALRKLQNPGCSNCKITEKYLNSLEYDSSSKVRKAVLENLKISSISLPFVIERTRDESEEIRACAYKRLGSDEISIDFLTLDQRMIIIGQGLRDRGEFKIAKNACEDMLCESWLIKSKNCDVVALLESLDIYDETNDKLQDSIPELIIKTILYKSSTNLGSLLDETLKTYTWDTLITNPIPTHAPINENINDSFTGSIQSFDDEHNDDFLQSPTSRKRKNKNSKQSINSSSLSSSSYSSSIDLNPDASNRIDKSLQNLQIHSKGQNKLPFSLNSKFSPESIILWRLLYNHATLIKDETRRDTLLPDTMSYCDVLQQLIEEYKNSDPNDKKTKFSLKQYLLCAKHMELSHDEVGRREIQKILLSLIDILWFNEDLISLSVELLFHLHDLNESKLLSCLSSEIKYLQEDISSMIINSNHNFTTLTNHNFKADESSISDLMDSTSILLDSTINQSINISNLSSDEKLLKIMETTNGQQKVFQTLILIDSILQILRKCPNSEENKNLSVIYSQVVLPLVQFKNDLRIRVKAIRLLGLFSLLDKDRSKDNIHVLSEIMLENNESNDETKLMAMQSLFDILLIFNKDQLELSISEIYTSIVPFLDNPSEIIRFTAAEGLAKSFFTGRLHDPSILYHLFILYFNPTSEQNPAIRQCLSVFFQEYSLSLINKQLPEIEENIIFDTILLLLHSFIHHGSDSQLSQLPIEKIIQYSLRLLQIKDEQSTATFNKIIAENFVLDVIIQLIFNQDKKLLKIVIKSLSNFDFTDFSLLKKHEIKYAANFISNIDDTSAKSIISKFISIISQSFSHENELNDSEKSIVDQKIQTKKAELIDQYGKDSIVDLSDSINQQPPRSLSTRRRITKKKDAPILYEENDDDEKRKSNSDDDNNNSCEKENTKKSVKRIIKRTKVDVTQEKKKRNDKNT